MSVIFVILVLLALVGGTALIGALCYVWMKNSRASQMRMEAHQERNLALLEEQNALLRRIAEK